MYSAGSPTNLRKIAHWSKPPSCLVAPRQSLGRIDSRMRANQESDRLSESIPRDITDCAGIVRDEIAKLETSGICDSRSPIRPTSNSIPLVWFDYDRYGYGGLLRPFLCEFDLEKISQKLRFTRVKVEVKCSVLSTLGRGV
jgi:hypothetical protein